MAKVDELIRTDRGGAKFRLRPLNCTSGQKDGGEAGSGMKKIYSRSPGNSRGGATAGLAVIGQPGWRLQTVSQQQLARSARVLGLLIGQRGLAAVLGGASGVDLADLVQGAGEGVEVGGVLMASLPQAEDDGRRARLLRKVAQVPGKKHVSS